MRLLHTSDWHVGRTFHGAPLLDHQVAAIDALVDVVRAEGVDVVLVAGDLYDRQLPSGDAVEVLEDGLVRLREAGARVVGIAGNHDSSVRVGFLERVTTAGGVTIRGRLDAMTRAVEIEAHDGGPPLLVYPVPYLEPEIARHRLGAPDARGHDALLRVALDRARADLARRNGRPGAGDLARGDGGGPGAGAGAGAGGGPGAGGLAAGGGPGEGDGGGPGAGYGLPLAGDGVPGAGDLAPGGGGPGEGGRAVRSVAVLHAFVAGGDTCDSERPLAVGGSAEVSLGALAGFDYVALGHLHRRQALGDGRVRYSGSPLAYSFSERADVKGAWLVDLAPDGGAAVEGVDLPVPRRLAVVRGTLDELLSSREHDHAEEAWVHAVLTDAVLPREAMGRLRARFPHALALTHEPPRGGAEVAGGYAERIRGRSDLELALDFVEHVTGQAADPAQRGDLVAAIAAVDSEDFL